MRPRIEDERTGRKESRSIEVPEGTETVDKNKNDVPEDTPIRQPWLKVAVVYELLTVDALCFHAVV